MSEKLTICHNKHANMIRDSMMKKKVPRAALSGRWIIEDSNDKLCERLK